MPDLSTFPVRVYFVDARLDDPKRSTMRKLQRFNLAKKTAASLITRHILLWPFAPRFLLPSDRESVLKKGIGLIETSWKRINHGGYPASKNARKLPLLVPVNQINFGRPGILSSVEALAAALVIVGERDHAEFVLSKFSWAKIFLQTNSLLLDDYGKCETDDDVERVQNEYFGD